MHALLDLKKQIRLQKYQGKVIPNVLRLVSFDNIVSTLTKELPVCSGVVVSYQSCEETAEIKRKVTWSRTSVQYTDIHYLSALISFCRNRLTETRYKAEVQNIKSNIFSFVKKNKRVYI